MRTGAAANLCFALPIFLGAFLLFQVQPLIGKFVLPWFGGGTSVWTTCLLFFQVALLVGYAYAHALGRLANVRMQLGVHVFAIVSASAFLPLRANPAWRPVAGEDPTWKLLALLTVSVGVPYVLLAATSPLIQAWYNRLRSDEPYRLYALSNVGSLLALITFPFVFEPLFSRSSLANLWSAGFVLFVLVIAAAAALMWRTRAEAPVRTDEPSAEPARRSQVLMWILLPACASALLLATTNKICQDIAVIPFLWVLPLSLYLLSFIICFDSPLWYSRPVFGGALALFAALSCFALFQGPDLPIVLQIGIFSAALFSFCMVLHGELFRLRPAPHRLTAYYLTIALGGALGGAFVGLIAPLIFNTYLELHWAMTVSVLLLLAIHVRDRTEFRFHNLSLPAWTFFGAGIIVLAGTLLTQAQMAQRDVIKSARNFYGVLRVFEYPESSTQSHTRRMNSGEITHGEQFMADTYRRMPTSYYHPQSGLGLAFQALWSRTPKRIGAVGLGIGTLACYTTSNDVIRFYEINPVVKRLADNYFTYLADAPGKVEVVFGDARLSLENEPPQHYDVLVLDAFSGDAIPVHLLTKEAFELYLRHLNPDGVLIVHVTNRHLQLVPVVDQLAAHFNLQRILVPYVARSSSLWKYSCRWMLLTRAANLLDTIPIRAAAAPVPPNAPRVKMWTDDYASLLPLIQLRENK